MNTCIICLQENEEGVLLQEHLICLECEQTIVTTDVDHPFYPLLMDQLKVIEVV